ncbi:ferroxidase HEPHL1 isoform X2 [Pleuronectes platessa]|uniref:ferroxidase HEPHL1 isoform X2 n=1 Tax=Pleuronectes platessa TaxID=8262 RepID=UPI00232A643E|nr:ferroxidase HEPHL1 isoform X2 [Pleuronectes platessa]
MAQTLRLFAGCLLLMLSLLSTGAGGTNSRDRVYYVGIIEEAWDYAPSGKNLLNGEPVGNDEHAAVFLEKGPHRMGSVYKKAMFRQYTDATYSTQAPRPEWLGFLGPILRAEVDDVITIHLKNFASRGYSMHPHGVFYDKKSEGALYPDGTSSRLKEDDSVPPQGSYTYRWEVRPEFAPTDDDANCLTWVYHSHVDAPKDIASGLIGALLTCKKGTLKETKPESVTDSARNDVDQDVFLMFNIVDENLSWYLEENVNSLSDPDGFIEDEDFHESNLMHAINGYMFGNLPGIKLCQDRAVAWHLFGMGNEVDIHTAFFHGNTLLDRGHRTDVISLFPATFATAEMVPRARGKWLLTCQVNDHLQAGMQAFYEVSSCGSEAITAAPGGTVRNFYLAAEKLLWSYAPSEKDLINNVSLTEADSASEMFFGRDGGRIGGQYVKVIYKEYTDNTFTVAKSPDPGHLGILGPVLRAEEGDTIRVTFMNKADRNYSIQPHGVHYDKLSQGTSYEDGVDKPGSHVGPGERFVYTWQVLEGPSPSDSLCIPYLYYSGTDPAEDTNSGLVGPLLVCKRGALTENGTRKDVDKEFFLLFSVMDENMSWYLEENIKKFVSKGSNKDDEDFNESNMMHAVNGRMYGNLAGLEMCAGDRVWWYTFGLGTEVDIHGVYFEGNTFTKQSTTRDTVSVFPHTTASVSMQPNTPGVYEVSCRVTDHYSAGMRQQYRVDYCPSRQVKHTHTHTQPTKIVEYFISAEEIEWDYSPERTWELEKHLATSQDSPGSVFVEKGPKSIGSRYKKVVYREYTDDTFRVQKKRLPSQQHLEIMGPLIKAEVGEQIVISFKNKATREYSIAAHGVRASGAHIPVKPGHILELTWDVPVSSGPGVSDPNCISYAYYSKVDFIKDLYSGLLGPLVICRPGTLRRGEGPDRQRGDVEKEFALLFMVHDENQSWYLDENIRTYLGVDPDTFTYDDEFEESNMMHGINGKLYGNLHGLVMRQGQKVDWYLLGMGNEVDMHTVHFHAETFTYKTDRVHRADVFDLFPGTFQTVEMVAGIPGTWLLHCHVTDHIRAGMETTITIEENSSHENHSHAPESKGSIQTLLLLLILCFLAVGELH